MSRRIRLLTTLLALATTATSVSPTLACPPGGRYCPPRVHRPVYTPPPSAPAARPVVQTRPSRQATVLEKLRERVASAKNAFAARNYGTALDLMNQVVGDVPQSNEALQFRSLIHFALADDKAAAADAYEALQYGSVWNRKALETLYGDVSRYDAQLRSLQARATETPDSLEVRFLLAFHNLMNGDLAAGEAELEEVLRISPREPLASRLLAVVRDLRRTVASTDPNQPE